MAMGFDFSQVLENANKSLVNSSEGTGYKYKLLYPGQGTLTVKLLFNVKSNVVMRAINRHTIDEDKIACMKTYGQECPICKVLEDIKNARGVDLSKMRSVVRGISLAQYVDSDYKVDGINPGDIILLMYPWTVYKDISTIIAQAKTAEDLESLMASNEGFTFKIIRGVDNKYTTQIDPFKKYKSRNTDQEFVDMLNGLDALNDQVLKTPATEEILKDVKEVAQELQQKYLVNRGPQFVNTGTQDSMSMANFGGFAAPQPSAQPTQPSMFTPNVSPTAQQPTTTASPNNGQPPCYGQHGKQDMNKCLLCPVEIPCGQVSNVPF